MARDYFGIAMWAQGLGFRVYLDPKVCKIMALRAILGGLGFFFFFFSYFWGLGRTPSMLLKNR